MAEKIETHSGRWAVALGHNAEPHSTSITVYVYTREDKIITTAKLRLTRREVRALLAAMDRANDEQSQMALPWADNPDTNVTFLPPNR